MRRAERGVGVLLILVMLVVLIGMLATYALTRHVSGLGDQTSTVARLKKAGEALEAYGASARRLPCPANPADDTGEEVTLTAATCTYPEGTLPWKTIGMRRDDAYDEWGYKLSYRVYVNNGDGSLTQPNGIDMSQCDLQDGASTLAAGRLCNTNSDIYQRNTSSAQFLANKGLRLVDMGVDASNRAYAIISHGPTSYGAYSSTGVRRELPTGDQRDNTRATGPFTIKAFSDPDTSVENAQHFDDLLFYRTVEDTVKRANLWARDWPEGATFNAATMAAATGSGAYRANVGASFTFMGNTFRASGGSDTFSFATSGGTDGIGVTGDAPFFNTTESFINKSEIVRIELNQDVSRVGFTLNHFGKLFGSSSFREQVLVRFYSSSNAPVGGALLRQGCRDDGGLASFVVEPTATGATFRHVELEGESVTNLSAFFTSNFLLSEFAGCTTATCATGLSASTNACLRPSINATFAPATITLPASSVLTLTITNGTDNPAFNGLAFTDKLPAGLVMANATVANTCGGTVTVPAAGSNGEVVLANGLLANNAASCAISLNVTASVAGRYEHAASALTATANLINAIAASSPPSLVAQ